MFKAFISKGHPEFSSNRQQDAQEFFLHLINLVEVRKSELLLLFLGILGNEVELFMSDFFFNCTLFALDM